MLQPNVLIEPLFNRCYAWPYLLSPATSAMYVAGVHLKVMRSFVEAPQMHVTVLKIRRCEVARSSITTRAGWARSARRRSPRETYQDADREQQALVGEELRRDRANARSYHTVIADCIDGIRDFLTLHYFASSRADTGFWKASIWAR